MENLTVPIIIALVGGTALLAGLLGGGEIKFLGQIPKIEGAIRVVAVLIGAALIGLAVWISSSSPVQSIGTVPQPVAVETNTPIRQSVAVATDTPVPPTVVVATDTSEPPSPIPPTPTNTPMPAETLTQFPEQAVEIYYGFINERQYEKSWAMLSPGFKAKNHPHGINSYVSWADTIQFVNVLVAETIEQTDTEATVKAHIYYRMKDGGSFDDPDFYLQFSRDPKNHGWLIYKAWR